MKLSRHAALEIAVTEDDGGHWTAPEVGVHAVLPARPWLDRANRSLRLTF